MACRICSRSSCTESFHSAVEQREIELDQEGFPRHDELIEALKDEIQAQARINGMGSEREARLMAELEDARNYVAEIAQGISHYPHKETEPCVRCDRDKMRIELLRLSEEMENFKKGL